MTVATTPVRHNRKLTAALAISAAVCVSAAQDVMIKKISGAYPFHEMQTIRCAAAMPVVIGFLAANEGLAALKVPNPPLTLVRGLAYALGSVLFYLTAAAMQFPEAVALYFTMPLLVAALAGPLLGERVPAYRALLVVAGFAGIVLIVKPGAGVFEPAALLGIACALFYAAGHMLTRPLGAGASAAALAVWQNACYLAVAALMAAVLGGGAFEIGGHPTLTYLTRGWLWPAPLDLALIIGLGITTGFLMVLFTAAYRLADSSFVAPFEYSGIVWAILFSFLLWHELPDQTSLAGIALIIGAGLVMLALDGRRRGAG